MDDGPRARWFLIASLAGFLIMGGAGCRKSTVVPSPVTKIPTSAPIASHFSGGCYQPSVNSGLPADFPESALSSFLRNLPSDAPQDRLLAFLHDQYNRGWNVNAFCIAPINGKDEIYFALYGFTEKANELQPSKILPEGEKTGTPNRIGYWTDANDHVWHDPILSQPIRIAHASESYNVIYQLSVDQEKSSLTVAAQAQWYKIGGGIGRADITYRPKESAVLSVIQK